MRKSVDLVGQRFDRLIVIADAGREGKYHKWKVRCDCGVEFLAEQNALMRGLTKSCGCLKREWLIKYTKKHKPYLLPRKKKERVA